MLQVTSLPGERLKGLRERMGLSPEALAEKSGVTVAEIGALEEWGGEEMTARHMRALSRALDVPVLYWTTQDAHEYILVRANGLPKPQVERLADLGERLAWAWAEQGRAWGDLFAVAAIGNRLQLSNTNDLLAVLSDNTTSVASPVSLLVLHDLGLPHVNNDRSLELYHAAIQLAAAQGITPPQLTRLVVEHLSSPLHNTKSKSVQ